MEKKKRKWKSVIMATALGACLYFAGISLAAWQISGIADNILTMNACQNRIVEEYEEPEHVDPSGEVSKIVHIANTGNVDTIVRVSLKKQFGTRQKDGSFLEDQTLDGDMILLTLNTKWWKERDGYYYYTEVLKAGETTKEPLLTSYRLSEEAGNAYKAKDARIVVNMESVQASGDAVSIWQTSCRELGITVKEQAPVQDTSVTYLGRENGFDIEADKTDLFANFKDLLPGCGRSQNILLKNASQEAVELLLRAEMAGQEKMSEEQLKWVKLLLQKYAVIELSVGERVLYSGPVSGNLSGTGSTMREDISLGTYPAGQAGVISVKLSLDPEMDQRFLSLTGKVRWIFTARGDEEETGTIYPSKTGVYGRMGLWLALLLAGCALAATGFAGMHGQKRERTLERGADEKNNDGGN